MKFTPAQLRERQAWALQNKIDWALRQIRIWYDYWDGQVYVSFSGGRDSTVLLHLVRRLYPEVPAVFCNTGLEFPEIVEFVESTPNVTVIRPKMTYRSVLEKYGYPVISKAQACAISRYRNTKFELQRYRRLHGWPNGKTGVISKKWRFLIDAPFKIGEKCCDVMKKTPMYRYERESGRKPILGTMAGESRMRGRRYLMTGCNAYDAKHPTSAPLSIWTEDDVTEYLKKFEVPYSRIYDMGYRRTGCIFCGFGAHMEESPNRFERLKETHPRLWRHCMETLGMREVLEFIGIPTGAEKGSSDGEAIHEG